MAALRDYPCVVDSDGNKVLEDELRILKQAGFFKAMERADILNRIGSFSVLLIGVHDGQELSQPVGQARQGDLDGMYFNAYGYNGIEILKYDTDPASPRYGLPVLYQLQVIDTDGSKRKQQQMTSVRVHYSRIVHLAEGSLESTIEGMSSLEQPWNALMDKEKTRGSSAEAYFRNSRQKLALEVEKDAKPDMSDDAKAALKTNVENFQNNWEDVLRLNQMKANILQPGMASPRDPFDVCVEEVAGTTGIPVRILTTKAGGQVTGSEDKATWNALILDRQEQECSVWLLDALSIMSEAGIIELPDIVSVEWSVQSALGELEASEASERKAKAFKSAVEGLSVAGADEVTADSVFKEVGLNGIEVEDIDFSDGDSDGLNE